MLLLASSTSKFPPFESLIKSSNYVFMIRRVFKNEPKWFYNFETFNLIKCFINQYDTLLFFWFCFTKLFCWSREKSFNRASSST